MERSKSPRQQQVYVASSSFVLHGERVLRAYVACGACNLRVLRVHFACASCVLRVYFARTLRVLRVSFACSTCVLREYVLRAYLAFTMCVLCVGRVYFALTSRGLCVYVARTLRGARILSVWRVYFACRVLRVFFA